MARMCRPLEDIGAAMGLKVHPAKTVLVPAVAEERMQDQRNVNGGRRSGGTRKRVYFTLVFLF